MPSRAGSRAVPSLTAVAALARGSPGPSLAPCRGAHSSWRWGSEGMVLTCVAQSQKSPSPARAGELQCPLLSTARSRGTQQGLDPPLELVSLAAHIPQGQPEGSCCPKPSVPAPLALPPAQDWAQPHCSEEPPPGTAGCHGLPCPQGPSRDPPGIPTAPIPWTVTVTSPAGGKGCPEISASYLESGSTTASPSPCWQARPPRPCPRAV